ncbi:ABC transporter permease [Shewanella sp. GD04112]|uniref:ABC transporter permease n=1 Tax=Shewanella sp. GD04112 TaxID=2975434 RepID=UPI00244D0F6A|nr:ABC transporter permease [Shewanella sp. GD04112]MDH0449838.1 ABC transporter permease [Shewanella sp. GD04112]
MFFYYLDLAWRSIKKTPMLSALMIMAISIGIGITITTLNIYKMMSINPAGEKSGQLFAVQLWSQGPDAWDRFDQQITYQDGMNLLKSDIPSLQTPMFRTGGAVQTEDPAFLPVLQSRVRVTNNDFFPLFGLEFQFGQAWDDSVDKDARYEVVLTDELNKTLFAGQNSVGKTIYFNAKPYQVVGVLKPWEPSPNYYDLNNGAFGNVDTLFVPYSLAPIEEYGSWGNTNGWNYESINTYAQRLTSEKHWTQYWVQLDTPEQVAEYRQWVRQYIEQQKKLGRFSSPKADVQLSDVDQWLAINKVVPEDNKVLVGLSALFLIVCLVNMLGLLLSKFLRRAPEIGVRRAIGASQGQIFAQHMVEVSLMGLFGGLLGLAWAWGSLMLLTKKFDLEASLTHLDTSMWLIAPMIAILAAVVAGIYPAWRVCTTNPSVYLKSQ